MGGKIWVESEPGAGCKFSFILPLLPPSTATNNVVSSVVNSVNPGKSK
jgi:chemotaxis protein histidine kinase CheA